MVANREIQTTTVSIANGELQIAAYLAAPAIAGSFPAVVVLQEIFGVNAHIRDITERLAQAGYVAIAPALYQRQAPGFEVGYAAPDVQLGRVYKEQTNATEMLSDIQATIDYLQTLPNVQPKFGCIGFCFGGHIAYLAATLPAIAATASFYGAGIATRTFGAGEPTITRTPEIKGKIYAFFGTQDPSIPPEEVDRIAAELTKYQIPHQIFCYPAEHGFFCDRRGSYNAAAATEAWQHVQQLFAQELASHQK